MIGGEDVEEAEEGGKRGVRWMSGRLTTEREPRVRGCSGSVIGAMRSGYGELLAEMVFESGGWMGWERLVLES